MLKLVTLVALTTGQRSQSVHLLDIMGMVKKRQVIHFYLTVIKIKVNLGGASSELVMSK